MEFFRRPVNPGGENIRKKTGRKKQRGRVLCLHNRCDSPAFDLGEAQPRGLRSSPRGLPVAQKTVSVRVRVSAKNCQKRLGCRLFTTKRQKNTWKAAALSRLYKSIYKLCNFVNRFCKTGNLSRRSILMIDSFRSSFVNFGNSNL